jgi:hypothetical protein
VFTPCEGYSRSEPVEDLNALSLYLKSGRECRELGNRQLKPSRYNNLPTPYLLQDQFFEGRELGSKAGDVLGHPLR